MRLAGRHLPTNGYGVCAYSVVGRDVADLISRVAGRCCGCCKKYKGEDRGQREECRAHIATVLKNYQPLTVDMAQTAKNVQLGIFAVIMC